jgi:hypothetical protein
MALFQPFTPGMLVAGLLPASHLMTITYGRIMIPFDQWNPDLHSFLPVVG